MPPIPLERGRAAGLLSGLLLFGFGFAVAAVVAMSARAGHPLYLVAIGIGFLGVGVVAFFLNRGTVPLPEGAIWSPVGLRALSTSLRLPVAVVTGAVYGLIGLGVAGNVLVPLLMR
jgi:hypothetical protein